MSVSILFLYSLEIVISKFPQGIQVALATNTGYLVNRLPQVCRRPLVINMEHSDLDLRNWQVMVTECKHNISVQFRYSDTKFNFHRVYR